MPKKFDQLLDSFQGNAYPAMIDDLALHLGVSSESLRKLGIGWCPIVTFKKGPSFTGWWVSPERDAEGDIVGLPLRSRDDVKVMYPGSKHGLVYEINPHHQRGAKGYEAGPQNWIRTMEAGRDCPVCGKPDGCLVSSENSTDPKAAVCIRVREGAVKPLGFGYLHILKSEGVLSTESVLAVGSSGVLVVVEGLSDTAAAMDLGFDQIGRPSNLAGMTELADLVRGYPGRVVIVGENDHKIVNGKDIYPGREGAVAAFQTLRNVHRDVKWVLPPENVKDFRAWKVNHGLTAEMFVEYVDKNGVQEQEENIIADDRPLTIARKYLDQKYRMAGRYIVRRWRNTWYEYITGKYANVNDEAFESPIYAWAHDMKIQTVSDEGVVKINDLVADNGLLNNMIRAMQSEVLISDDTPVPCWINGANGPSPSDIIAFGNGLLTVEKQTLAEPTPDFFTMAALPFAFDPTATCPAWLDFLNSSLGDDPVKIALLQEWMGYCMTPDKSQQKMLFMRGPTAAGKSEILNVICQLVGKGQYAATDFGSLAGPFGLQPLIGKLVCTVGDARVPRNSDAMRGLEIILNITGNDDTSINRKNKDQIDAAQLMVRISMASNEFLDLPDHANALLRRLLLLEFSHSFVGREDRTLRNRLEVEIPGIAVWALEGLKRLREQGHFSYPASSKDAEAEWRIATNPLAGFIDECCDVAAEAEVSKESLFEAWDGWSGERGFRPLTRTKFHERMKFAVSTITAFTHERGGKKLSVYRGVKLKNWAARKFTGEPPR